ncbi:MAG: Uma2 family endonuclease [Caldilinea sp. CFX5]|nr:Uma2 family endonuclease [Caldilinea sp. CFX5]
MVAVAERTKETSVIRPHRWTRAAFDNMVLAGIFEPDARIELIEGEILDMGVQSSWHAIAIRATETALRSVYQQGYEVRSQMPLAIGDDSEPAPDVVVVPGSFRDYRENHPTTALLVVEVSYSTLHFDRNRKLRLYARSGIPEYWILNVVDMQLEVHRDPRGDSYGTKQTFYATDVVSPLTLPTASITVADLLP